MLLHGSPRSAHECARRNHRRHASHTSNEFFVLNAIRISYDASMNFRPLRTFIEIAETGGVGRAAARLHLTQPTASRQLRALEVELGVPLFDRIGRRVQLTSEGEDLLPRSRRRLRHP